MEVRTDGLLASSGYWCHRTVMFHFYLLKKSSSQAVRGPQLRWGGAERQSAKALHVPCTPASKLVWECEEVQSLGTQPLAACWKILVNLTCCLQEENGIDGEPSRQAES